MVALQACIVVCSFGVSAKADADLLLSRAYWVDPSGKATLADALTAPFRPYDGTLSEGYSRSSLWLRLGIAGQSSPEPVAVVVTPQFLERIELYQILEGGADWAVPLVSGRDIAPDGINHVGLRNGFIIHASPLPRTLYLRISTSTALTAYVDVMPLAEAVKANRNLEGFLAVYIALLSGFCLWGLISWLVRREAIYGLFVIRQVYALLFIFALFGLFRFYILPDETSAQTRSFVYTFIIVTVISASAYFDLRLLAGFGAARWLRRIVEFALLLPAISVTMLVFSEPGLALRLNAYIVNFIMLLMCLFALSVRDPEQERYGTSAVWIIRIGFTLLALVICIPSLMHQNVIQTRLPVINFIVFQALLSASIMVALLSIQARRRDLAAQAALLEAQIKERELQEESTRRREKEKFLSMLTHELRNPLGVIRLVADTTSPGGRAIEKAALDMAGIIERVEQSEKLDSQQVTPEFVTFNLSAFLADVAAEKPFADRVSFATAGSLHVSTDGLILKSILWNLLDNAIKYSPADKPILLSMTTGDSAGRRGVKLEVTSIVGDAGAPDPEMIFTKYYRSRGAHHKPGSGLGLFLVASWAKTLGGRVDYELKQGDDGMHSVSFSVWLPS